MLRGMDSISFAAEGRAPGRVTGYERRISVRGGGGPRAVPAGKRSHENIPLSKWQ